MILMKARMAGLGNGVSRCAEYVLAFLCDNAQGDALGTALHESLSRQASAKLPMTQSEASTELSKLQPLQ